MHGLPFPCSSLIFFNRNSSTRIHDYEQGHLKEKLHFLIVMIMICYKFQIKENIDVQSYQHIDARVKAR
jgi:hypothetical protein